MSRARIMAVVIVALSVAARAAGSSDPAERARAILGSGGYQADLPHAGSPEQRSTVSGRAAAPGAALPPPIGIPVPPDVLLLIVLTMAIAAGLWLLLRRLDMSLPSLGTVRPEVSAATVRPRTALGDDPEALARDGRFAEAIHALLLDALRAVGRRAGSPPAWTSREVLRGAGLSAEARAALTPLVGVVEAVHFGRAGASLEDYVACAAIYRRFQEACSPTR